MSTPRERLYAVIGELFPRNEVYVLIYDDGDIAIDGTMKLDQVGKLFEALKTYFAETGACPF